ncbi:MAG: D-alanyl-D-alanine endopeptidase [Azonexus sp.]|jgi:D-alanyl-D-alanine endopeptidase (penicillin-binding protein 7)|nr:D-alanyl-D-alanine endopeptidase [Azonexus sp.]
MKGRFGTAILLAAMLGLATPVSAASVARDAPVVKKTAAKKVAAKKTVAKKTVKRGNKKIAKAAKGKAAARPVRHANLADSEPGRLALQSASVLVLDQNSGETIVEKQSDAVQPIASITKLMTAMVVLDAGLDLNEVISIGEEDVDALKGSTSRLPVGTTMTRETALLLALMSSENRAASALGRHYPGGLSAFVEAMNRKAVILGMYRSHFEEPTGLSSNNVSTAHDLARLVSAAAADYPEIRQYSTTAGAQLELHGRIREFVNTNTLVRSDNWEIGLSKTGFTAEAGRCLVMQAKVAGKPVVIVLLDSNGKMTRVGDANRIKRWMESVSVTSAKRST